MKTIQCSLLFSNKSACSEITQFNSIYNEKNSHKVKRIRLRKCSYILVKLIFWLLIPVAMFLNVVEKI